MANLPDMNYPIDISIRYYENFYSDYTKVPSSGIFDVTSSEPNRLNINLMQPNVQSYVRRDFSSDPLHDFIVTMEIGVSQMDGRSTATGWGGFCGLIFAVNEATHVQFQCSATTLDGLSFYWRNYTPNLTTYYNSTYLREWLSGGSYYINDLVLPSTIWSVPLPPYPSTMTPVPRWIKMIRSGTSVSLGLYDVDPVLNPIAVPILSYPLSIPDVDFNYFIVANSHGAGLSGYYYSGYVQNCLLLRQ